MTVEEYIAQGGTITRCPTVYLMPVVGADMIRSGVSDRVGFMDLPLKERERLKAKRAEELGVKKPITQRQLRGMALANQRNQQQRRRRDLDLLRRYEAGETVQKLAEERGVTYDSMMRIIRRARSGL